MFSKFCSKLFQLVFNDGHQFCFTDFQINRKEIFLFIKTTNQASVCVKCNTISTSIHSKYQRKLLDLPILWFSLYLIVQVRRFFCKNPACEQKIFTESISEIADRYSRMTNRLKNNIVSIGFELGGEASLRIARLFNISISADTILRAIAKIKLILPQKVKVLGIDDWALRKGQIYGTVLVDLEKRSVIDLLPDRSAESLANWLKEHDEVEVISRDRASAYIKGANEGAPQAIQVADRWHLLKNFCEVLEKLVLKKFAKIRSICDTVLTKKLDTETQSKNQVKIPIQKQAIKQYNHNRKLAIYNQVNKLHQEGISQRDIAKTVGIDRKTVRNYINLDQFPININRSPRTSVLDPFKEIIHQKWNKGVHNAAQMYIELKKHGYLGSAKTVRRYVHQFRIHGKKQGKKINNELIKIKPIVSSPKKWIQLLLFDEQLESKVVEIMDLVFQDLPELKLASTLGKQWKQILLENKIDEFEKWMANVEKLGSEFNNYVISLKQDRSAIENAIRLSWSNGQVEGQVNRIKAIKRQMYGRASFQLLRNRVLYKPYRLNLV